MIHLYTDASYDQENNIAGWAYVIVQDNRVISRSSGVKSGVKNIEQAEAHAILMGVFEHIISIRDTGLLVIWCDNIGLVRKLQDGLQKDYDHIINYLITHKTGWFVVNYCPRRFNKHAKEVDQKSKRERKNG